MQIVTLASAATATGAGATRILDERRMDNGPIPLQISGTFVGTVKLEGSISTEQEINESTAVWSPINGGEWTTPTCDSLFCSFPYIRANVTAFTSGSITVKALI